MPRTVFLICNDDQRLLLLPDGGSIWRLALWSSQDEAEFLALFMDGVIRQADHTRLLNVTWGGVDELNYTCHKQVVYSVCIDHIQ